MSDMRTNEQLATAVRADILWLEGVAGVQHWPYIEYALNELLRRADEAAVYKLALGLMGKRFESLEVTGPELAEIALDEARKALAKETDE